MYSLIWQSVTWRPGKLRFLIGVKNPLPIRPTAIARKHGPLCEAAPFARFGLQSGYARLSSRIWRHSLILIDARFSSRLSRSTGVRTLAAARSAETRRPRSGAPEPTLISLSGDIPAPQRRRAVA